MKRLIIIVSIITTLLLLIGCLSTTSSTDDSSTQTTDTGMSEDPEESLSASIEGLENILINPGFESGLGEWGPFGFCKVDPTTDVAHTGSSSMYVSGRTSDWEGAGINLFPIFEKGATYVFAAWIMMEDKSSGVKVTVKRTSSSGDNYDQVLFAKATAGEWIEVMGEYYINPNDKSDSFTLYIEGPPPGTNFYVDDVKLVQTGS